MDLHSLGTPEQLWDRWVQVAAGHAASGRSGCEIRRGDGCALLGDDRAWLRLRRLGGNRAVLWGHHDDLRVDRGFHDLMRDEAPDWSYDVDSAYAGRRVGFFAWHAQGSWSCVGSRVPAPVADLLGPVRDDDAVLAWWSSAWPDADPAVLAAALAQTSAGTPDRSRTEGGVLAGVVGAAAAARATRQVVLGQSWASRPLSAAATGHLRGQIHAQMRSGDEIDDRGHPARPPLLRQWARVHAGGGSFSHAIGALGPSRTPTPVPSPGNHGLDGASTRSLDNVLMELRMSETDEASGAWLFARVTGSGRTVRIERRYDTWPVWYDATTGPTMSALHAEMAQRTARWRPSWASLLPVNRF